MPYVRALFSTPYTELPKNNKCHKFIEEHLRQFENNILKKLYYRYYRYTEYHDPDQEKS